MKNPFSRRRAPRNTEREAREAPIIPLAEVMAMVMSGGTPGDAIVASEKEGQRQFVNSETLPTEMGPDDRAALEAAGVKFGEVVEGDPLFQYVELPEGWRRSGTGHDMWSDLLDNKGRKRAAIFYKAAFYDRRASLNTVRRFGVQPDYGRMKVNVVVVQVTDGDTVVYTTDPVPSTEANLYEVRDLAMALARQWLDEHYPDWGNAPAYWN